MRFKSAVYSEVRGSVAGLTYQGGKGGLVVRARHRPSDPRRPEQSRIRAALASLRARWRETLTEAQRAAWRNYAAAVLEAPETGPGRRPTGEQLYVRFNLYRLQARLFGGEHDSAPSVYTQASARVEALTVIDLFNRWVVAFDNTDEWAHEVGGALLCYGSRPQNQSVVRNRWGYQLVGVVEGDPIGVPTSPKLFVTQHDYRQYQTVFGRVVVLRADGRAGVAWERRQLVQ